MRYMIPAFAALVLAASPMGARAQGPAGTPAPAPTSPAQPGDTTATPKPAPKAAQRAARASRMSRRFAAANTTHDGHLTLDQARAAKWTMVVRHFSEIDADKKGFVTEQDIRTAAATANAAKAAKAANTAKPALQKS